jgi:hypothetical protein
MPVRETFDAGVARRDAGPQNPRRGKTEMRTTIGPIGLLALLISFGSTDIYAQGNSQKGARAESDTRQSNRNSDVDVAVNITFGSDQVRLIRTWFNNSHNLEGLPPGLANRESLPPGLERQLQRNGTLPPGLAKKVHAFPVALERHLPELRPGLSRVIIGGTIVLLDGDLILDVAAIF